MPSVGEEVEIPDKEADVYEYTGTPKAYVVGEGDNDPEPPWVRVENDGSIVGWLKEKAEGGPRGYHVREEVTKAQVGEVKECPGVTQVWEGRRYSVWVVKGEMWEWVEVEGCLVEVLGGDRLVEIERGVER
jgi:hypothetical protein